MRNRTYSRPYVGIVTDSVERKVFRSIYKPAPDTTGFYVDIIGPFKTVKGARFMADNGYNNPSCVTVSQAERLAKNGFASVL